MKIGEVMTNTIEEFAVLSLNAFLSLIPFYLGGSAELTVICIFMFFADLFLGIIDAARASKLSASRFYAGIMKIASLFFALTVVGVGTYSFRLTFGDSLLGYSTFIVFNGFVFTLVMFQLQSINRHLARLGFQVNKFLDVFLTRLTSRIVMKIFKSIDKIAEEKEKEEDEFYR